jgi:hypothetical protein
MILYRIAVIVAIVCATLVSSARAQIQVHVTRSDNVGQDWYWYTALACDKNLCMAAAVYSTGSFGGNPAHVVFLRSLDGGLTWSLQDPGLESRAWNNTRKIRTIKIVDSLTVIAFGDSNLVVETTDGGETWSQQTLVTTHPIEDISFSSPMDGILVAADTAHGTYLTSDGGQHWRSISFVRPYGWICHAYGNGMYRIFKYETGEVYTTRNNWNTFDSTGPIHINVSSGGFVFGKVSFGVGDTMLAYGNYLNYDGDPFPCIARTSNGGSTWALVYFDTLLHHGAISHFTSVDRDTIIAVGSANVLTVLRSFDNGQSWKFDTITSDDSDFDGLINYGLGLNAAGDLVGTWSSVYGFVSTLVVGQLEKSSVVCNLQSPTLFLYPNPATTFLTISDAPAGRGLHILDMLGRVVGDDLQAEEHVQFNISSLPSGVYFLSDGQTRARFVKE